MKILKSAILITLALCLSGCASSFLNGIAKAKFQDINDAAIINSNAADQIGLQCTTWIDVNHALIVQTLAAKTSGPISLIAKRRSIELLYANLYPKFEIACGPVLMDERQRLAKYATLFR